MKRLPIISIFVFVASLLSVVNAQPPISVTPVTSVPLPWGLSNLTMIDGRLYANQNGVLFCATPTDGVISTLNPDTTVARLCTGANYVVRNGGDSLFYFTTAETTPPYSFNVHTNARFFKNRHVEIKSWFRDICHPVFSADGNTLIFSSKGKVGLGGYDLWCSFWNGKRWSKPVNLGNTINTVGDEICPVFYGNYLVYSSNGMPGAPAGFSLYAVRIPQSSKVDDVIFANYVVQPLPEPINSAGDDREMAFDLKTNRGYWLSNRNGHDQLFTFSGDLDGVMLTGIVSDDHGRPIPSVDVRLLDSGRLVSAVQTDSTGTYRLFSQPGDDYCLQVSKPEFFQVAKTVTLIRPNEDLLIASQVQNITLSRLPFDRVMIFDNIYAESSDIELTPQAEETLQPVVNYLRDNPNIVAEFTLYSSQTDDEMYANLVIERRISNIQRYLKSCLPSDVRILFKNGIENGEKAPLDNVKDAVFVELFRK